MGHTSIRQLDGELKSSLIFEFQPIFEGGIFSGANPGIPEGEGARLPATNAGADPDTSIYVRHKGNPFMDFCANMYVYIGYRMTGNSTLPVNLEVYGQRVFLQATPDLTGPIGYSLVPPGNTTYESTYGDISATYTMKVEDVTRNSIIRFEIVRVADTNPDDLIIEDVNFLMIPSYVDLTKLTLYPAAPVPACPPSATPGILSNKGELLGHDGIQDVAIPPPGGSPRVLTHTGSGPSDIEWVDPGVFVGTNKLYNVTPITADKTLVDTDTDFIYKLNNTSGGAITVDLPLASTLANGNFFAFQVMATATQPVNIEPQAPDSLFDLTGGAVGSINLSTIGETAEIITDGTNWFVYNIYEEGGGGGGGSSGSASENFTGVGGANEVFTLSQDAVEPYLLIVNGGTYFAPTYFTVGGAGNRTWTWQDNLFAIEAGDEVTAHFGLP